MRRIERIINLVAALLESPRPMTAQEIRERIAGYDQESFEAFRRAFERDKESLRAMGVPIELRATDPFSDQADGYTISKAAYYLPKLDLEPDELAALRIAAGSMLGGGEEAGSGLLKLSVDRPLSEFSSPRVVWGADLAAEQPLLGPLYSAVLDRRRISFSYQPASRAAHVRTVRPYALVHRRGHWYVVGHDEERNDIRSFRVSRITSDVQYLDGSYEVPSSFNADAYVGEPWAVAFEEPTPAVVRFDDGVRWWAEQNMAEFPSTEAPSAGLDVQIPVGNLDALISWAIGFGGAVTILAPDEAVRRMREHLQPLIAAS
jgi:predicted DNA-binding transcriptional regulator YafY